MISAASLRRRLLSASALASVVSLAPLVAGASGLPDHGHFVSGQGTIAKGNQSVTVKQSSTTGIINWNSFSVGKKDAVTFHNGAGATLNRVTGGNLSTIAGSLHATGSLYLMNGAGVIVSGTGHIVTGGSFVASSGSLGSAFDTDNRFKAGAGKIVNRGTIVSGGNTTLVGSAIADSGSIRASSVQLSAAHRLGVSGSIAAQNSDGSGGTVIATGSHIKIGSSASIDASGTKGGTVLIGGDIHGGAIASDNFVQQTMKTANITTVAAGAHIAADGSKTSGGNIVIWSDGHTSFAGAISAEGQSAGGFAEVSSHDLLGFTGRVDLTSNVGETGTLLLDPENVTIEDGTTANGTLSGGTYTTSGDNSVLSVTDIEAALATANVLVQTGSSAGSQSGDITVLSPVTWSSGHTLTLDAYRNIDIDAAVTITGAGGLSLIYGDQSQNQTGDSADGSFNIFGNVAFTDVESGNTQGSLSINGASYTLVNSISQLSNNTSGNVAIADSIDASGTTYSSSPVGTFTGTLEGLGNTISNLTITSSGQYTGLIGENDGTVRDLGVVNATINSSYASTGYVGTLAGYSQGTLENDYATGTVQDTAGFNDVGGLVGRVEGGTVEASHAAVTVTGGEDDSDGGLVGITVERNGSIQSLIQSSYATGAVSGGGAAYVGGLAGTNGGGTIATSYATGAVTGTGDTAYLGGLAGRNESGSTIDTSYATGNVSNTNQDGYLGGLVGDNSGGALFATYATGSISGGSGSYAGGLVGFNSSAGLIDESYELGAVSGGTVGGIAGDNQNSNMGATFADYFNTTTNPSAPGSGADQAGNTFGESFSNLEKASTFTNWDFGALGSGNDWVIVDQDGSLNSSNGGTTPMLLTEYSTTITNAHQLQLMELDPTASYTLASNIDASATSSGNDVWGSQGFIPIGGNSASDFSGTFEGLGNTISNLTINASGAFGGVGLFGVIDSGIVNDVGLVNANVSSGSADSIGVLAGVVFSDRSSSVISNSYATGSVAVFADVGGGLVGTAEGGTEIIQSYANVSVLSGAGLKDLGGLVGDNFGTIKQSYATGLVGGSGNLGGLVGGNYGSIAESYATGIVSGQTAGGLVGDEEHPGGVTNSYWDTDSSGITNVTKGAGNVSNDSGITGLSTAALTGMLPTGFDSTVWGNVNNQTTPYLLALTSNPQTVYVGDGSEGTFSLLFNMAQVQAINNNVLGNYALADSLDASSVTNWLPIGEAGIFDGLGNTISNLTIADTPELYVGLFGIIGPSGVVRNLGFVNANVSGDFSSSVPFVGALAGDNQGTISNSYATGTVESTSAGGRVGGLTGLNSGTIQQSYSDAAVIGDSYAGFAGGLVGNNGGEITQSYATGAVSSTRTSTLGGLVGNNIGAGNITQSYATGNISLAGNVGGVAGGLVGQNVNGGSISQSYATGQISGVGGTLGGLVGSNRATITDSYFDTETSGFPASQGAGDVANDSGITGLSTAGLTGVLPNGFNSAVWGNVNNQTTPYLLALTSNPQTVYVGDGHEGTFSLLFTAAQVQAISNNLSGNYALANAVDASSITNWIPIGDTATGGSGSNFTGVFNGLGNTISNLSINDTQDWYVGLFASNSGTISNLALANASVTVVGNPNSLTGLEVGALAGGNSGTIENVSISGTVSVSNMTIEPYGVGGLVGASVSGNIIDSNSSANISLTGFGTAGYIAGGLLGLNTDGLVSQSYSTGSVTVDAKQAIAGALVGAQFGTGEISQSWSSGSATATSTGSGSGSTSDAGGLLGLNFGGTVSQSYAIGSVSVSGGASQNAGGLVGDNDSTITQSYAIGMVTGGAGAALGGLIGSNSGNVTSSYFDTETSGLLAGIGDDTNNQSANVGAVTTAALQSASILSSLGGSTVWSIVAGESFPYLKWQGAPQFITGTIYSDSGATDAGGGQTVSLYSDGTLFGTATTYANGYYYVMLSPGTFTGNLLGTAASVSTGNVVATNVSGSVFNANIYGNTETLITADTSMSGAMTDLASAYGSLTGGAYLYDTGTSSLNSNIDLNVTADGRHFTVDALPGLGSSNTLTLNTAGNMTQSVAIRANALVLEGGGNFNLRNQSNNFGSVSGSVGNVDLRDNASMTVGALSAKGDIHLNTWDINIDDVLAAAGHVGLNSSGAISENGSGAIDAHSLRTISPFSISLTGSNDVRWLDEFYVDGDFIFTNGETLGVRGALHNTFSHDIILTTTGAGHDIDIEAKLQTNGHVRLDSSGAIVESGDGAISAFSLSFVSADEAVLEGNNNIAWLDDVRAGGNVAFTDDEGFVVRGNVDKVRANKITLTTTGGGQNITLESALEATGQVRLVSSGEILESGGGAIHAHSLSTVSAGETRLGHDNAINWLDSFTSGGEFVLTDDLTLGVRGSADDAGSGEIVLTTTGSGHDLDIEGALTTAGHIRLVSSGAILESGTIDAHSLSTDSAGNTKLNGANDVRWLDNFTSGGNFVFADDQGFGVRGVNDAASNNISLTTTGTGNDIKILTSVNGKKVTLNATGEVLEKPSAAIAAQLLNVTAVTGIRLASPSNAITAIGIDQTTTGPNKITL